MNIDDDLRILLAGLAKVPEAWDYLDETWAEFLIKNNFYKPGHSLDSNDCLNTLLYVLMIYPMLYSYLDEVMVEWVESQGYFDSLTNELTKLGLSLYCLLIVIDTKK